jgi:GrpB-like predicted nucleotidyltransferase (UPF0157 family)
VRQTLGLFPPVSFSGVRRQYDEAGRTGTTDLSRIAVWQRFSHGHHAFGANLEPTGTDASGDRVVRIAEYDPAWRLRFAELGGRLRDALGSVAIRIDHIGSTSVPGLAAKPVIDIQVSVDQLEPVQPFCVPLQRLGFVYRSDNPERTKRYFRESPGHPRTHIQIRRAGSFSEQFPLLFRDFLRADSQAATDYETAKRSLAEHHGLDGHAYTDAKGPIVWQIIHRADDWAQQTGWEPGPSDA